MPLSFAPGDAYQFDWSHEIVFIAGATTTIKVGHVWLCHSRMFYVRAYPRESQEMVFDAHDRAFAFFGGGFGERASAYPRAANRLGRPVVGHPLRLLPWIDGMKLNAGPCEWMRHWINPAPTRQACRDDYSAWSD